MYKRQALGWAVTEMLSRYKLFAAHGAREIESFNKMVRAQKEAAGEGAPMTPGGEALQELPHYVIIVDELADLMMAAPSEVEDSILSLIHIFPVEFEQNPGGAAGVLLGDPFVENQPDRIGENRPDQQPFFSGPAAEFVG